MIRIDPRTKMHQVSGSHHLDLDDEEDEEEEEEDHDGDDNEEGIPMLVYGDDADSDDDEEDDDGDDQNFQDAMDLPQSPPEFPQNKYPVFPKDNWRKR